MWAPGHREGRGLWSLLRRLPSMLLSDDAWRVAVAMRGHVGSGREGGRERRKARKMCYASASMNGG